MDYNIQELINAIALDKVSEDEGLQLITDILKLQVKVKRATKALFDVQQPSISALNSVTSPMQELRNMIQEEVKNQLGVKEEAKTE